jgi:hypothetical protein
MAQTLPWATGRVVSQARASEKNNVRVFSAKGLSAPGTLGTSPLPQIGTLIPGTPYIYVKPRLSQDDLGGSGGSPFVDYRFPGAPAPRSRVSGPGVRATPSVHRTNPAFAFYRQNIRTPSIGMGRALQMGATMDVRFQNDAGFFSVA